MSYQKMRGVLIACGIAATWVSAPLESSACSWLCGGWGAQTTYRTPYFAQSYAPAYSAPACNSCTPQTVRYVPQTSYRTVYRSVPVTTYGASTYRDRCTGCPVTYYRPVTSWTYQAAYVPYTTYRLVYSNACSPSVGCDPCSPCGASVGTTFGAGSACCTPGTSGTVINGAVINGAVPPPAGSEAPDKAPPMDTFKGGKQEEESESPQEALKPTADPEASTDVGPDLTDPGSRTTLRPVRQATRLHLIASPPKPTARQGAKLDDGGWRASKK